MKLGNGAWRWTLASGLLTMLLAVAAFFLPNVGWAPKGGLVGWLLFLAGLFELALGTKRRRDAVSKAAIAAGFITAAAGTVLIVSPASSFFSVANIVTIWLLLRAALVLGAAFRVGGSGLGRWVALTGLVDMLLGGLLATGMPVAVFVTTIFGATYQLVASFAVVLSLSFAVTSVSQIAIALTERVKGKT